jgi:hypothetical protein
MECLPSLAGSTRRLVQLSSVRAAGRQPASPVAVCRAPEAVPGSTGAGAALPGQFPYLILQLVTRVPLLPYLPYLPYLGVGTRAPLLDLPYLPP